MVYGTIETKLLIQYIVIATVPLVLYKIPIIAKLVPLVVLQIIWGIFLGPSCFGLFAPGLYDWIFTDALMALQGGAFWGLLLFTFYTGLHIDVEMMKKSMLGRGSNALFWPVSLLSLFVPFVLGVVGSILLEMRVGLKHYSGVNGSPFTFSVAVGISAGVTALPVLGAILLELNLLTSDLGKFIILCASVHDMLLWIVMTVVLAVGSGDGWAGKYQPLAVLGLSIAFLLFSFLLVKRLLGLLVKTRWWKNCDPVIQTMIHLIFLSINASLTDAIGIHPMIGAVIYGVILPHKEKHKIGETIDNMNRGLLLPLFFGSAGLSVNLTLFTDELLWLLGVMMAAVIIGRFFGTVLIVRASGRSWSLAWLLFSYFITKGVVELVVAFTLFDRDIISQNTYTACVLMAVICTSCTKLLVFIVHKVNIGIGISVEELYTFSASESPLLKEKSSSSSSNINLENSSQ